MSDERVTDQATEPAHGLKQPPFKRGTLLASARPLISLGRAGDPEASVDEPPATLLFNDVTDDALICDPNDPDCDVV